MSSATAKPGELIRAERQMDGGVEQLSCQDTGIALHRIRWTGGEWSAWRPYGTFSNGRGIADEQAKLKRLGWTILEPGDA